MESPTPPTSAVECAICRENLQNPKPKIPILYNDDFEIAGTTSDNLSAILDENKNSEKTICRHYFHRDCLSEWTKTKNNCPLCRAILAVGNFNVIQRSIDSAKHQRAARERDRQLADSSHVIADQIAEIDALQNIVSEQATDINQLSKKMKLAENTIADRNELIKKMICTIDRNKMAIKKVMRRAIDKYKIRGARTRYKFVSCISTK